MAKPPRARKAPKSKAKPATRKAPKPRMRPRQEPVMRPGGRQLFPPGSELGIGMFRLRDVPHETGARVMTYPVSYRFDEKVDGTPTIGDTGGVLLVLGPLNDVLCKRINTPGGTATAQTDIVDPFLTNLMNPSAGSYGDLRWLQFQVDVMVVTSMQNVNGSILALRWEETGLPIVAGVNNANYTTVTTAMIESARKLEVNAAACLSPMRVSTGMTSQNGLNFMSPQIGSAPWVQYYGTDTGSAAPLSSSSSAWAPICIHVPAVETTLTLRVVVSGMLQYRPPEQSFLSRMTQLMPPTAPDVRHRWFLQQQKLLEAPFIPTRSSLSRAGQGFVGQ